MKEKGVFIVNGATYVKNRLKRIVEKLDFEEVFGEISNREGAVSLYRNLKSDLVTMDLNIVNYDEIQAIKEIIRYDKSANTVVASAMKQ